MTWLRSESELIDAGLDWIGSTPKNWEVRRLGHYFSERRQKVSDKDFAPLSVTMKGVVPQLDSVAKTNDGDNRKRVCAGDFVINSRSDRKGSGGVSPLDGSVSLINTVLKPHDGMSVRFAGHLLTSYPFQEEFYRVGNGIVADMWTTKYSEMKNIRIAVPPIQEQVAIASYLDRATARIDALIAKKTRFIELLRERRQALITHSVTRGLDEGVPTKDSGVEWLGEVPAHWNVSKLAYVVREQGGKTPSTTVDAFWNGDIPWITPKDMKFPEITGSIDKISEVAISGFGMTLLPPNTILVVVRGMILTHSFPVAELKVPATINQDMKALIPVKGLLPKYLRLLLESYREYVVSMAVAEAGHGTRVLRTEVWRLLPVLLPPYDEQQAIVAHLDRAIARIDNLVAKTERSIDLLREHRTALITAAVTGKIDLRDVA